MSVVPKLQIVKLSYYGRILLCPGPARFKAIASISFRQLLLVCTVGMFCIVARNQRGHLLVRYISCQRNYK